MNPTLVVATGRFVTGNPAPSSDGQRPFGGTGGTPAKPPTWGDAMLARSRRLMVSRLEPATQTRSLGDYRGAPIDGELYTPDCRRGNIRARVLRGGRPKRPTGSTYKLHPFAGAKRGSGLAHALPVRVHENRRKPLSGGKAAPNATIHTLKPLAEVAAAL